MANTEHYATTAQAPHNHKDITTANNTPHSLSFVHPRLKDLFSISTKDFPAIDTFHDKEGKNEVTSKAKSATIQYKDKEEEESCKKIIYSLTNEELEEAASTSFKYYNYKNSNEYNGYNIISMDSYGIDVALRMAKRHLYSEHGNYKKALQRFRDALAYRKALNINALRSVFQKKEIDINDSHQIKTQILSELSKQPMVVRGYDKLNRALLLILGRSSRSTDKEAFINTHMYMIERALACTEHATNGAQDKIAVVVNCANFEQVPSTKLLKEFFHTMEQYYPNQLAYLALIDAPVLIRSIWFIVKPFIHPEVVDLIKFVSGDKEKIKMISPLVDKEQAMPFLRPDGKLDSEVDVSDFLEDIPFQYDYGK